MTCGVNRAFVEKVAQVRAGKSGSGLGDFAKIDARIELTEGVLALVGPARRVHVWGIPYVPDDYAMPVVETWRRAPYRRTDGRLVDQVLTTSGAWLGRCLVAP